MPLLGNPEVSDPEIMDHVVSPVNDRSSASTLCPICEQTRSHPLLNAPDRFHGRTPLYSLLACEACGLVWLENPPTPEEMSYHYDEAYHRAIVAAGEGAADSRWHQQRELIHRYKQSGAILDLGCSSGGFLGTMKSPSWTLHGIEMESQTASRARLATGAEVFVGNVTEAPFAANSFDVVTCFDVLEHVYDPGQFLRKVHEWLKPGGIFYVMLPNIFSWEARALGSYWYGLELPRHLFHFSPQSLRNATTAAGLKEEELCTPLTSYAERSADYLWSALIAKLGFQPRPQSEARPASFAWKAIRKLLRLSLIFPFSQIASASCRGASMEAIFSKGTSATSK